MILDAKLERLLSLMKLGTDHTEEGLREIARSLRSGEVDPNFLRDLGNLLDPDLGYVLRGVKLVVKRKDGGKPKALRTQRESDLERFLELHIDFFEEKYEAVIATAMERFGFGRTKCVNALNKVRARRERDPEVAEMHRQTALLLREHGDPDYQPL